MRQQIGSFINIEKETLYFKGCDSCQGYCCKGANGFMIAPLILDDFAEVYRHFPILFSFQGSRLMAYLLLNNGQKECLYFVQNRCTIYEQRPPACRLYPISPYFDALFVDTKCPSINAHAGEELCREGVLREAFYTKRLENFAQKREATQAFLKHIYDKTHFDYVGELSGMAFYAYNRPSDDTYLRMHRNSLKHLENYFEKTDEGQRAI
jgi:hypothetical protein